ncbi:MAG: DegT/DnrJ/EryC1/StrS family aminotransferase [Candidatus Odinarchaeota archaeon]
MKKDEIHMAGPWITEHEIKVVEDAMRNGWYWPDAYYYVETFQKEFAKYHNREYGIMTPNCTTAIHLLLTAMGIKDNDEVIVPDCTWIASVAPIAWLRAKPIFCDIDPLNWCLDPESVEKAITPKTKAILVVDLFGNMPLMDELFEIAEKHGIPVVEDSAEALGSVYKGKKAGKFGIGSVFSFHRTKTITTGEGGMLLLDDGDLYERAMFLRDHGRSKDIAYYNTEVAYKYMPFNLQAALGYAQFQRIDELVAKKREIYYKYKEHLASIEDLELNAEPEGVVNGAWVTGLVFGKSHNMTKEKAMKKLTELGLPTRPFFYPLSSLPAFPNAERIYRSKNPNAYDISSRGINLPCAFNLSDEQIATYSNGLRKILGR